MYPTFHLLRRSSSTLDITSFIRFKIVDELSHPDCNTPVPNVKDMKSSLWIVQLQKCIRKISNKMKIKYHKIAVGEMCVQSSEGSLDIVYSRDLRVRVLQGEHQNKFYVDKENRNLKKNQISICIFCHCNEKKKYICILAVYIKIICNNNLFG